MKRTPDPMLEKLLEARLHDPFKYLGAHRSGEGWIVRAFNPNAARAWMETDKGWIAPSSADRGLFEFRRPEAPPRPWRVRFDEDNRSGESFDPYAFSPQISEHDLFLFNAGRLHQGWRTLGAVPLEREGVAGTRFAVWAPNAERVSVVGDFNRWDGRRHPMATRGVSGVWELFVPGVAPGALYKFEIRSRATQELLIKTDPYGRGFETRPRTAAVVSGLDTYRWGDGEWMAARAKWDWLHAPVNVYEVHPGSWRRHPDGRMYTYRELADSLIPYLVDMRYTHVELMPITEHPLDESWGYQTTGYFAATSRFGPADDLRAFIDTCHRAGIGVLLDWVPGHFPLDEWALQRFDGTALYEHEDPKMGLHRDWGTHVFNYGRMEVRSFLLSSANYWLSEFHFDGLRVDAVAAMLYLDYSRPAGEWIPNRFGGRENLEAIDFLRALNAMVHGEFAGAVTVAEESTAWPMVSRPTYLGGLGFSMKWNMGWMHDTLSYFSHDPVHRRFHHDRLTFSQIYAYTENFTLPLSHDEVVHGKGSLFTRMPGDEWQKMANLRLLACYQLASPGKKLNFQGNEFGQRGEWRARGEAEWFLLAQERHAGLQRLVRDLNGLYRSVPALHDLDFEQDGFRWVDCHDADQSILGFIRRARDGSHVIVVLNFTPVVRRGYRIGVPCGGEYQELINTDSTFYGGSDVGNGGTLTSTPTAWMGLPCSLTLTLPPLGALILQPNL